MKLKNKKTGEIWDFKIVADYDDCTSGWRLERHDGSVFYYDHIDEIHADWEYAPGEPKETSSALDLMILTLTNFIENEPDEDKVDLEDCKQMLDKLKAWKRLKKYRFEFGKWRDEDKECYDGQEIGNISFRVDFIKNNAIKKDLDLLFSGGEE